MSKEIKLEGWISIIPNKMFRDFVKKGYLKNEKFPQSESGKNCALMNEVIDKWYKDVFLYVETWLIKNKFIRIKKGSFRGGFCVESDPKSESVTHWGAPLDTKDNKVIQIKEKYGRVVVYFRGLTKRNEVKIKEFSEEVEKKFDCETYFS